MTLKELAPQNTYTTLPELLKMLEEDGLICADEIKYTVKLFQQDDSSGESHDGRSVCNAGCDGLRVVLDVDSGTYRLKPYNEFADPTSPQYSLIQEKYSGLVIQF